MDAQQRYIPMLAQISVRDGTISHYKEPANEVVRQYLRKGILVMGD